MTRELSSFLAFLPHDPLAAPLVFDATGGAQDWLQGQGCSVEVQPPGKDLRFLQLKRERFHGAWLSDAVQNFSIEEVQRIVSSVFQSLIPAQGIVGLIVQARPTESAWLSMMRQSGYRTLIQERSGETLLLIARRA